MTKQSYKNIQINKLAGRYLFTEKSSKSNREILLIYDFPMNLEMVSVLSLELAKFGNVTAIDLPGSGQMDSFYKIKTKPNIDQFAAYVASIVSLRYKRRRVTIVGIGFGATVAFRFLQKHPVISKKVDAVVSVNGYSHFNDFKSTKAKKRLEGFTNFFGSHFPISTINNLVHSGQMSLQRFARKNSLKNLQDYKDLQTAWKNMDYKTYSAIRLEESKLNLCVSNLSQKVCHIQLNHFYRTLDDLEVEKHLGILCKKLKFINPKTNKQLIQLLQNNKQIKKLIIKNCSYLFK